MDKKIKDIGFWLCLGKNIKIGSVGIQQILETKVDIESIFNLPETNLRKLGLSPRLIEQILICRQYDPNEIVAELKNHGVSIITLNSPGYPRLLKEIHTPPTLLYYKGRLDSSAFTIGIVGSRKPTDYGRQVTYDLAYKLASSGTCIVSGLALGIDSIAHEAALDAGGQTIAVLGCGLDTIYPKKHEQLAKRIRKWWFYY